MQQGADNTRTVCPIRVYDEERRVWRDIKESDMLVLSFAYMHVPYFASYTTQEALTIGICATS